MRIDLRTGRPCTNPKATRRNTKAEDAEIRSCINARALGMTTRALQNLFLAAALRPSSLPSVRRRALLSR